MGNSIYKWIDKIEAAGLHVDVRRHRKDTILLSVTGVGLRLEIDFFFDGRIEYSVFRGNEDVEDDLKYIDDILNSYNNQ